jgi:hypothetical protein
MRVPWLFLPQWYDNLEEHIAAQIKGDKPGNTWTFEFHQSSLLVFLPRVLDITLDLCAMVFFTSPYCHQQAGRRCSEAVLHVISCSCIIKDHYSRIINHESAKVHVPTLAFHQTLFPS